MFLQVTSREISKQHIFKSIYLRKKINNTFLIYLNNLQDDYYNINSHLQNDHGGPLIVRYQGKERVIGVISACKIDPKSHSCHGPFLYTSIYRNRQFISCAIHKDVE